MDLDSYFQQPGAKTVTELRTAIGAKSDAQVRQWRKRFKNRQPDPRYAVLIEVETDCAVRRWDCRPDDWFDIWPELLDDPDAPPAPDGIKRIRCTGNAPSVERPERRRPQSSRAARSGPRSRRPT